MVLPVYIIGSSVLRKKAIDIDENYSGLSELIEGDSGEGLITAIIVGNANSIASSNFDIKFIE